MKMTPKCPDCKRDQDDCICASPASAPVTAPDYRIADRGFRWDAETRQHIPQLLIEFAPVPANEPNDSKGWKDRDSLAAMLAAAPTPPVSEDWKDAEIERLNSECDRLAKAASKNYRDNGLPINEEFYKQADLIEKQSVALQTAREALFDMQDSYAAVHGWKDSFVIAATTAIAAIDALGEVK